MKRVIITLSAASHGRFHPFIMTINHVDESLAVHEQMPIYHYATPLTKALASHGAMRSAMR